jgi:hypothetical protein
MIDKTINIVKKINLEITNIEEKDDLLKYCYLAITMIIKSRDPLSPN